MKPYIKPTVEYLELRVEESLASAYSNPAGGPNLNAFLHGHRKGLEDRNPGKGEGPHK